MGMRRASESYTRFAICQEMKWTLQEYDAQPLFFLEEIAIFLKQQALKSQDSQASANREEAKVRGMKRYG